MTNIQFRVTLYILAVFCIVTYIVLHYFNIKFYGFYKSPGSQVNGTMRPIENKTQLPLVPTPHTFYTDQTKDKISNEILIVSGYFELAKFQKTDGSNRTIDTYMNWGKKFQYITNPVILYTDSQKMLDFFTELRSHRSNTTKVVLVKRSSLWPFQHVDRMNEIYADPNYPKIHPNTIIGEYTAMTHSKMAVLDLAMNDRMFHNRYIMWLDIGYFRDRSIENFSMELPPNFDSSRVTLMCVHKRTMNGDVDGVMKHMDSWVGGGIILGRPEVVKEFIKLHKKAVLYFLSKGLSNAEEQVIYATYLDEGRHLFEPHVEIQPFERPIPCHECGDVWFYLGHVMRKFV